METEKRPPTRRAAARREEILDAAVELFSRFGYRGTGLIALGKRVGMTHAGILSYFGTKEGLLRAVMARHEQQQQDQVTSYQGVGIIEILSVGPVSEPAELARLTAVLRAENLSPGDPLYEYFMTSEQVEREFLAKTIRISQKRGEVRADIDPDIKAIELLAFSHGLEIQWLLDPEHVDRQAAYQSFARTQLADLAGGSHNQPNRQTRRTQKATAQG